MADNVNIKQALQNIESILKRPLTNNNKSYITSLKNGKKTRAVNKFFKNNGRTLNTNSVANAIKNMSNAPPVNRTVKQKKRMTKPSDRQLIPWVPVDISSGTVVPKVIVIPGISNGRTQWKLSWRFNKTFPRVNLHGVKYHQVVGECKNNQNSLDNLNTVCRPGSKEAIISDSKASKRGLKGLSIDIIRRYSERKNSGPLFAKFLELKRNGDYGQVATALAINSDRNLYLLKPGDDNLVNEIKQYATGNPNNLPAIINQRSQQNNYYFNKCVFWTHDRPAAMHAMMSGVTTVLSRRGMYYTLPGSSQGRPINKLKGTQDRASDIVNEIIDDYINTKNEWFDKLCIIDTYHDFWTARGVTGRFREKMRQSLVSLYTGNPGMISFINSITNISKIENAIGELLTQNASAGVPKRMAPSILSDPEMCIVHDAGSIHPSVKNRVAILSARVLDPASASLG